MLRRQDSERYGYKLLLAPFFVAAAGFAVSHFVETDYEKIDAVVSGAIIAATDGDVEGIGAVISPDYSDAIHNSREELLSYCRRFFTTTRIEAINRRFNKIVISGPVATTQLRVRVHMQLQHEFMPGSGLLFVEMKLHLAKTASGKWLVNRTELVSLNNQPFSWKSVR